MAKFVILCCLIALWGASVTARPTDEETEALPVPLIYSPVCGKDEMTGNIKTFANKYNLKIENTRLGTHYEVMKEGDCEE